MPEAIGPGASLAGGRGRTRAAWGEGRGGWSGAHDPGPEGARSGLPSAWSPQWVLGKAELPTRWTSQALLGEGHRGLGAPLHRWQGWSLVLVHSAQPRAQGSCCAHSTPAPTRGEAGPRPWWHSSWNMCQGVCLRQGGTCCPGLAAPPQSPGNQEGPELSPRGGWLGLGCVQGKGDTPVRSWWCRYLLGGPSVTPGSRHLLNCPSGHPGSCR